MKVRVINENRSKSFEGVVYEYVGSGGGQVFAIVIDKSGFVHAIDITSDYLSLRKISDKEYESARDVCQIDPTRYCGSFVKETADEGELCTAVRNFLDRFIPAMRCNNDKEDALWAALLLGSETRALIELTGWSDGE